ncbi:MAG: hypothetical protein CMF59_20050 [Leptospiraceae bacterium]|nr:hypothetical protein [Leptospiraceae bacterium]
MDGICSRDEQLVITELPVIRPGSANHFSDGQKLAPGAASCVKTADGQTGNQLSPLPVSRKGSGHKKRPAGPTFFLNG